MLDLDAQLNKVEMSASELQRCVKQAFKNAKADTSKITTEILAMDGMTGKKTRHFYNNLLSMEDARYLEIGTWKGSSVCSGMCGNKATVVCIDNWSQFGGPKDEFLVNFNKYRGENTASFIEQDCFTVDISQLPKFNIYMFDGDHHEHSQYQAIIHYYPCLDDVFIFIVDDWNWSQVRTGTFKAFKELNLQVVYSKEISTPDNCFAETWWNGIYVAVLQKGPRITS